MNELPNDLYYWLKASLIASFTALIAQLSDIKLAIYVLGLACIFNIVLGIRCDRRVNNANFSISKAWDAIKQLFFYGALIYIISVTLTSFGEIELRNSCMKWITFMVVAFYLKNATKNAKQIWPNSQAIIFLDLILSTELIPHIKNMIGFKNKTN